MAVHHLRDYQRVDGVRASKGHYVLQNLYTIPPR